MYKSKVILKSMMGSTQTEKAIKLAAKGIKKPEHPLYSGKFWIYEEKKLVPYDEWKSFYKRQANEKK
jgi:hypothetical protein